MAKPKPPSPMHQISFGADDKMRALLEKAARQSIRTLSAEILFRLRRSFDQENDDDSRAAA
jgi:hypothetical protein